MKTAPYELTPEDHLSPDGSQERIIDPKKAAHMGHAAHQAFRHFEARENASKLLKAWRRDDRDSFSPDTPLTVAIDIQASARRRAKKRALDTGDFSKLRADTSPNHLNPMLVKTTNHYADSHFSPVDDVDHDVLTGDYAYTLADKSKNDWQILESMEVNPSKDRQRLYMDGDAKEAGERYDEIMESLQQAAGEEDLNN